MGITKGVVGVCRHVCIHVVILDSENEQDWRSRVRKWPNFCTLEAPGQSRQQKDNKVFGDELKYSEVESVPNVIKLALVDCYN